MQYQPPLDGVSLVPLLDGRMKSRPEPMGFWDYPIGGIRTPSKQWMESLLKAQQQGKDVDNVSRLRLDAGATTKKYPLDTFPGHAAWLDWPWKLHRIEKKDKVNFELYNLAEDPKEQTDVLKQHTDRAESMKAQIARWQQSVVRSLNGEDYH